MYTVRHFSDNETGIVVRQLGDRSSSLISAGEAVAFDFERNFFCSEVLSDQGHFGS